jgi:hypothetical protein
VTNCTPRGRTGGGRACLGCNLPVPIIELFGEQQSPSGHHIQPSSSRAERTGPSQDEDGCWGFSCQNLPLSPYPFSCPATSQVRIRHGNVRKKRPEGRAKGTAGLRYDGDWRGRGEWPMTRSSRQTWSGPGSVAKIAATALSTVVVPYTHHACLGQASTQEARGRASCR